MVDREHDYEEISLRELIEIILKGKKLIAFILICSICLSFFGTKYMSKKSLKAETIVSLNFRGISDGKNPDGTRFDMDKFKSPEVLQPVIKEMNLNETGGTVNGLRKNMTITPIVPNHITEKIKMMREEGEDFKYNPNEFVISLNVDNSSGITEENMQSILNNIVDSYIEEFNYLYSDKAILASAVGSFDYSAYDYPEISRVIHNQINIINGYLNSRISEAPDFRSKSTGMTFGDIRENVEIIDSVDLNRMDSIIGAFNLTKDKERLIINYEYQIKKNELAKSKKNSESQISKEMMQTFEQETSSLIIPGVDQTMKFNETNSYYDQLAARSTNAGVSANNIDHDIAYLKGEIEKLQNDTVSEGLKAAAVEDVMKLTEAVKEKLQSWIEIVNETADEYYEKKLSEAVMKLSPAEIYSNTNTKLNVAIGGVLGLMIAVFIVFFKSYWQSSAKPKDMESNNMKYETGVVK